VNELIDHIKKIMPVIVMICGAVVYTVNVHNKTNNNSKFIVKQDEELKTLRGQVFQNARGVTDNAHEIDLMRQVLEVKIQRITEALERIEKALQ